MKSVAIILCILMLTMAPVLAQEADLPDAGVKPGSLLYGLDKAFERIELTMARGNAKKAEVHLKHAKERLSEAKVLSEEEKAEHVKEALDGYEEDMGKTVEEIEKAKDKGQNVSAIVKEVNESIDKHVEVLKLVLEKVPEKAKAAIQRNIDRAIENNMRHKAKIVDIEEREKGVDAGNKTKGIPEEVETQTEGKPEDVGRPEETVKPENAETPA